MLFFSRFNFQPSFKTKVLKSLLLIFGIFGFLSLEAQLFTVSTAVEDSLTQGEQDFRQRMLDSAYFLTSQSVEIADFQALLNADTLDFNLPDSTGTYRAVKKLEYIETNYHYDYLWAGQIENEFPGYIMLIQKDSMIGGFVQIRDKTFFIIPLGFNEGLFMQSNHLNFMGCGKVSVEPETTIDPCEVEYNTCSAEVHVLMLLTPEYLTFISGLFNSFQQHIILYASLESANLAFINSDIPNKRIRYSFVNYSLPSPLQFFGMSADLDILTVDPVANELRDNYRADIVCMLVGLDYFFPAGLAGPGWSDSDKAYSIVQAPFMFAPNWTITHEISHIMRADHNTEENCGGCGFGSDEDNCSHGLQFAPSNAGDDKTPNMTLHGIMQEINDNRLINFSNPDILFNGIPTGTINANNAKTIRNGACIVADYRSPNAFFTAFLFPPQQVCEDDGTFYINGGANEAAPPLIGHPPFTYSFSATGSNCFITSVNSNGAVADIDFVDIPGPSSITVNLVVTSSDGGIAKTSKTIMLVDCLNNNNDPSSLIINSESFRNKLLSNSTKQNQVSESGYQVFPNPASNTINLLVPRDKQNVILEILDSTGKVLLKIKDNSQSLIELNITKFPNGEYILKVIDEEGTKAFKVIKLN